MPIDWDAFESELDSIIEEAAERTDERLASMISSVTRMTYEEVEELFPTAVDIQKLASLMKVVRSAQDRNTKLSIIVSNADEFAGTILTLLEKYV
jgi:NADP-dependent 3-hydroxy acid dehydrogenase YdfG